MPNLNERLKNAEALKKRLIQEMEQLLDIYGGAADEVNERFRSEYHSNKGLNGIEEFLVLNNIMKKNMMSLKSAHALLKRARSTAGFDVEEAGIGKELEDILKG